MISSIFSVIQGWVKVRGNSDDTLIGNIEDRLKTIISYDPLGIIGLNTYSSGIEVNAATSGVNNPVILLRNPSGSGKIIYIWEIIFGASYINNVQANFHVYSNPTVTINGSAEVIGARNIGAGQGASVALITSLPSVSSLGTKLSDVVFGQNTQSGAPTPPFSLAIQPNNSVLITAKPGSNNRQIDVTILWKEIQV